MTLSCAQHDHMQKESMHNVPNNVPSALPCIYLAHYLQHQRATPQDAARFWLASCTNADHSQLPGLPADGFEHMVIRPTLALFDESQGYLLPSAATCSCHLTLARYSSPEQMVHAFKVALTECSGFGVE